MNYHKGTQRAFSASHKTYYADKNKNPSWHLGFYAEDGGTTGEFEIQIEPQNKFIKLDCYSDSFDALLKFSDVLEALQMLDSAGRDIVEKDVWDILWLFEIEDITKYHNDWNERKLNKN